MERVSDKELWALIQVAGKHPNYLLKEKFWDTIVSAFTELRERRAAENYIPHPACPCVDKNA